MHGYPECTLVLSVCLTVQFSYDTAGLHSEVPALLLPAYLGGEIQDSKLYSCVTAAKKMDQYFSTNIHRAR